MKFFLILIATYGLIGCNENGTIELSDNQNGLTETAYQIVNPSPTFRPVEDIIQIQFDYKILVGVIGSGVDYNHPDLINHIKFEFGKNLTLSGAGYDFAANDPWPSPYVGRESRTVETSYAKLPQNGSYESFIVEAVKSNNELSFYADPNRNVMQEYTASAGHETHVAGLITQRDPRIGILPYRYLPVGHKEDGQNYQAEILDNFIKSVKAAIANGAKIINISSQILMSEKKLSRSKELMPTMDEWKNYQEQFSQIAIKAKDVLFIAGAGNEAHFIKADDPDNVAFPCGVKAANILCVGSLDKAGNISSFSNSVSNNLNSVYTIGENLESTYPMNMCGVKNLDQILFSAVDSIMTGADSVGPTANMFMFLCDSTRGKKISSGTSQATPLVTNFAAKIMIHNPHFSPTEVIQKIISKSLREDIEAVIKDKKNGDQIVNLAIHKLNMKYEYLNSSVQKEDGASIELPSQNSKYVGNKLASKFVVTNSIVEKMFKGLNNLDLLKNTKTPPKGRAIPTPSFTGFIDGDLLHQQGIQILINREKIKKGTLIISETGHDIPLAVQLMKNESFITQAVLNLPEQLNSDGSFDRITNQAQDWADHFSRYHETNKYKLPNIIFLGLDGHRRNYDGSFDYKIDPLKLPTSKQLKEIGINKIVYIYERHPNSSEDEVKKSVIGDISSYLDKSDLPISYLGADCRKSIGCGWKLDCSDGDISCGWSSRDNAY